MTRTLISLRGFLSRDAFLRVLYHFGFGHRRGDPERFAVFVIDVDGPERLNALLSDGSSDQLVDLIAGRLGDILPPQSLVSRTRPAAVCVVGFETSSDDDASDFCTRLHETIRRPMTVCGREVHLSVSVGVAFAGRHAPPLEALQCAERAVERVKVNGGDATFFHKIDHTSHMEIAA